MDNYGVALALAEALTEQGFCAVERFGVFVTYERENDSLKIHGSDPMVPLPPSTVMTQIIAEA